MAEKIFNNVRLTLKVDTLENWMASSLPLKKGELAFATVAATAGTGLSEPVVMVKIGEDGVKTFKDLDWNFHAKASDVLAACKSEAGLKAFVNSVIADAGIATSDAMEALAGRVTTAEGKITTLEGEMDAVEAKAAANETAIGTLNGLVGDKKVSVQISEAIAALNLADTYDAKGAAATAESNAKTYADGLNTAMDTRMQAVEGTSHSHTNKVELDKIVLGDKAKWDAMEQNAKDYADGLDEVMDGRVAALEAKFGDGEGNVESQIEAAVSAETEAREAADEELAGRIQAIENDYLKTADKTALQEQITANDGEIAALQGLVGDKAVATQISEAVAAEAEIARAAEKANADAIDAIEADYLKAADKTELEGKITANANAIELLTNGVSAEEVDGVNDLIQYVKDHGTEVTGIKGDIKDNADAIAAIEADYLKAADKTALQEQITANDGDITALQGRATTVEGKVATLEGEMDTAEGKIATLEGKVGDKAVATQISEAIEALKIGDYAKAADLAAAVARVGQNETDIEALEGRMDAAEGEIEGLAAIAKSGNVNDLVQTAGDVIIFDCGTSAV